MRVWILSDLHLEMSVWRPPVDMKDRADVVVLAGDVHNPMSLSIDWLTEQRRPAKPSMAWRSLSSPATTSSTMSISTSRSRSAEGVQRRRASTCSTAVKSSSDGLASSDALCGLTTRSTATRRRRWPRRLAASTIID